jgi:hypothetical protein
LYALPAAAFARGSRPATADDIPIGQPEAGVPFVILPALDAIDRKKRIELFDKDARVLRTPYRFPVTAPARDAGASPLAAVHDVLSVGGFTATSFAVVPIRAVYTFEDGHTESVAAAAAAPSASATPSGAPPPAPSSAPASPPPPPDLGTRWVYLAAAGGLLVGGLIAAHRKRHPPPK